MNYDSRLYWRLRAKGWRAQHALNCARTKWLWESEHARDNVRLKDEPDDCGFTIEDLAGDAYDPKCNPDIQASRIERERKEFVRRVDREGVWFINAEYRDPRTGEWKHGSSLGGVIGDDMGWEHGLLDDVCAECLGELAKANARMHLITRGMCE